MKRIQFLLSARNGEIGLKDPKLDAELIFASSEAAAPEFNRYSHEFQVL